MSGRPIHAIMQEGRGLSSGALVAIRTMFEVSAWRAALVVLMPAIQGALAPAQMIASGFVVGAALAHRNPVPDLLLYGCMFALASVIAPLDAALCSGFRISLDSHVLERAMRAVMAPAGIAHLEDPVQLDRGALAKGMNDFSFGDVTNGVTEKIRAWTTGLLAAAIVAGFRWWLAPLLIAVWWGVGRVVRGNLQQAIIGGSRSLRRAEHVNALALKPEAAKEIRIYGLTGWLIDRFSLVWLPAMRELWATRQGGLRRLALLVVPVLAVEVTSFALAAQAVAAHSLTAGGFTALAQALFAVAVIGQSSWADFQLTCASAQMLALRRLEAPSGADGLVVPAKPTPCAGLPKVAIRFEEVHFSYRGRPEVLAGVDLEIPAGSSLALVGSNGAGKTTLIKLLSRLYDPAAGRIVIDGIDLRDLGPDEWRARLAVVFQDSHRWPLTVRDLVSRGRPAEDRLLEDAAELAAASRIVRRLPRGWDSIPASWFEGGADVSGGEWQRIALTGALADVRRGAGVLVLDEPAAHLDARAEAGLHQRFLDITAGSTTIVVSHRFSTVRRADRIAVLEGGRIAELGSHDELVAAGGTYARMFELQARRFREPRHA